MRIFINTKGKNPEKFSQEFLDLMEYITNTDDVVVEQSKSKRLRTLHECVKKVKLSEKVGVKLMQTWEEHAMIKEEGRMDALKQSAENLMKSLSISLEKACELLGSSQEDYDNLYRIMNR